MIIFPILSSFGSGGESSPPAPRIEPTNNILTVLILYDSESSPTVVVVVVVVGYATPAPVLCARFASDFANADFAKDDWVMGDGKEKFCSDAFPKITNGFPRLRYLFELGGTVDIQSPWEGAICNFILYGQRQLP